MAGRKFNKGDRFAFIDEVGGGVVLEVLGAGHVRVRTDEGFVLDRSVRELVRVVPDPILYRVTDHQAGMVKANDVRDEKVRKRLSGKAPKAGKTPKKAEDQGVAEVDLHLHELVEDESRLSPGWPHWRAPSMGPSAMGSASSS
jgi:hypothetical protein